jgi:hypothetical protein
MPQDHGVRDHIGPDAAMLPVVDVGAADAGVGDAEEDRVWIRDGGDGSVFEGDGFGAGEDEGGVLLWRVGALVGC